MLLFPFLLIASPRLIHDEASGKPPFFEFHLKVDDTMQVQFGSRVELRLYPANDNKFKADLFYRKVDGALFPISSFDSVEHFNAAYQDCNFPKEIVIRLELLDGELKEDPILLVCSHSKINCN